MMPLILKYTSVYIFPKPGFSPISAQYNQSIEPVQILPTFPLTSLLFLVQDPNPGSHITPSCHASLLSVCLLQFFSLSVFHAFEILKTICTSFYRFHSSIGCFFVSDAGHVFLLEISKEQCCALDSASSLLNHVDCEHLPIGLCMMVNHPLIVMLILTAWISTH